MHLIVSLEHRFSRTPDGVVWTQTMFPHSFWQHYLTVFDHVRVVARVRDVAAIPEDWQPASGAGVSFVSIPYYVGLQQYLLQVRRIQQVANNAVGSRDAVILRVGSPIAACIEQALRRTGHPYGVEVVGDPYDVFAPGAVHHPLRPFFRWWFSRQLRRQCAGACAAAYVTAEALQRRYPPDPAAFTTHYSCIELSEAALVTTPRPAQPEQHSFQLIMVGSLEQLYKAPDVLIDAVAACVRQGLDLQLTLVGDGKHRAELEQLAVVRGIEQRVHFRGQVPAGAAVRAYLDQADLFVLPSRAEGLPRAMIEAMARGLPCIGSTVGGIPELLPAEDMVPPGDVAALARKIREIVTDPERMARMSARNLEQARQYDKNILGRRRNAFYSYLRQYTIAWVERQVKSCVYYI